ncbi:ABC transporter permease [Eubacteriales bacterium OttesenSCG-928-K08]|nr:ABC transporter permease [Eubacteriales bacterium OttesenSCG-928-K08]
MSGRLSQNLRTALGFMLAALLLLMSVLCWSLAKNAENSLRVQQDLVFYQSQNELNADMYYSMQKTEQRALNPSDFALWVQQDGLSVDDPVTRRSSTANVLFVKGDTRLVLPAAQTLANDDEKGCLIDKSLAAELFKTTNAVGNTLRINGQEYTVRAVCDAAEGTVLLRATGHIALFNVAKRGQENKNEFALRHGLQLSAMQPEFYSQMSGLLTALPTLGILLLELVLVGFQLRRTSGYPLRYGVVAFTFAALFCTLIFTTINNLPVGVLPASGQGAGQYAQPLKNLRLSFVKLFAMKKDLPNLLLGKSLIDSTLGLVSVLFFAAAVFVHSFIWRQTKNSLTVRS